MGNHSYAMEVLNKLPKKQAMMATALVLLTVSEENSAAGNTFLFNLDQQAS